MGHFHSGNLDRLFMRHLYAKGMVSQKEIVNYALKKKEYVHASEGIYKEKYMLQVGIASLFFLHYQAHHIQPVEFTDETQDLLERWISEEDESLIDLFDENGESIGDLAKLESIQFLFAPGYRKLYRELVIDEIDA
jgi:hypothetical protein